MLQHEIVFPDAARCCISCLDGPLGPNLTANEYALYIDQGDNLNAFLAFCSINY